MAVTALEGDFGLTALAFTAGLQPISARRRKPILLSMPEAGELEIPGGIAVKGWCGSTQASSGDDGVSPEGLQVFLWRKFFSDPTQWRDDRRSKRTPHHPDFRHKKSKDALWLDNLYKPVWVDVKLASWDAGMSRLLGPVSTTVQERSRRVGPYGDGLTVGTCSKLCADGKVSDAVEVLNNLVQRGCQIRCNIFYRVLKRCTAPRDLVLGRRIHALTVQSGYEGNAFLATHLIDMYASHGRLEEAMRVFSKVTPPSVFNWAAIIFAYARHGEPARAIGLYRQMRVSTIKPDNRVFVAVLKACAGAGNLAAGKDVHNHICADAVKPDIFVQTCLVDMYAKCGSLKDAQRVFDTLSEKNVVTWNAMIACYGQQGMGREALRLYRSMQHEGITHPSPVTFVCLLQACAGLGLGALHQGKQLHAQIEQLGVDTDVVVGASLVNMYAKCGSIDDAQSVFDRLSRKNVVTWTAMIAGYSQQGFGQEALSLYSSMQQEGVLPPDSVTFVCLLQACASVGVSALQQGKQLDVQIEERGLQGDVVVGNSLVNMYAKCGSLEDAQRVFDKLHYKDVVTWTSMIAGYTHDGFGQEALNLYSGMQKEGINPPDSVTFVCLLHACAVVGVTALPQGKELHILIKKRGLESDVDVANTLVNMYGKCGSLEDALRVFDRLSEKNVVTWNAMIAGYSQQGMAHDAFGLYSRMQLEGLTPANSVTFVCLLQACASAAALPLGKQLHAQIEEQGLQADVTIGNSLVNMYAKCGSMVDSQQVFDSLLERDGVGWGALIAGYTRQGDSKVVFDLVDQMRQEGIQPNSVTFLSLLTVCSHVGLVDKGQRYFESMGTEYGIAPTIEHYTCMVDLLGRAGHLDEALQVVKTMPFQPDTAVWLTLLGTCRKWSNVKVGQEAFQFAMRLDENNSAAYVLMSNIYAGAQMWVEAEEMQARRLKFGAWKEPGQSWWADVDGVEHRFVVGDKRLPESGRYIRHG